MTEPINAKAQQYLKNQIESSSPAQVVVMLYDATMRNCRNAKEAIKNKVVEDKHKALVKAQDITLELLYSVNRKHNPELATNLANLYSYCYIKLVEANVSDDLTKIDEVMTIITDLNGAWKDALVNAMKENGGNAYPEYRTPASDETERPSTGLSIQG